MTGFLKRLMTGEPDSPIRSSGAGDRAGLERDLAVAQTRIRDLEGDLEGMEAELAKAEDERGQIERLTEDMAASQVRAAATVGELNRAKTDLETMNSSLADHDRDIKQALAQANSSNQEKDQMFAAVTKAIEEINKCLSIASSRPQRVKKSQSTNCW
jgi:ABC-type transporter Mla subunit MlaD